MRGWASGEPMRNCNCGAKPDQLAVEKEGACSGKKTAKHLVKQQKELYTARMAAAVVSGQAEPCNKHTPLRTRVREDHWLLRHLRQEPGGKALGSAARTFLLHACFIQERVDDPITELGSVPSCTRRQKRKE